MLIEDAGDALDRRPRHRGDRFHEEEDRSATGDDRGHVPLGGLCHSAHGEPEGPVFVGESMVDHFSAHGGLEFRPGLMSRTAGHRRAPWIASTTACAKPEVRTSFEPGIWRARSYVTTFEATTVRTASRNRTAASCHPRYSSIITPASISAVGFTLSIPAYFGALPWTGSNTAWASPKVPPAPTPRPPIWAAAASLRESPFRFVGARTSYSSRRKRGCWNMLSAITSLITIMSAGGFPSYFRVPAPHR